MSGNTYFTEHKKGEVNELRMALQATFSHHQDGKQKLVVKKIIAAMTLGMDVSPLFMDMVKASNTKDIVQKKLVYLYLTYYAKEKPDLSLLVINTLQKDCRDDNPMIRGLALRAMTNLRIPSLIEHMVQPLKNGLLDITPYVRKTAAISCAKLYQVAPSVVSDPGIINKLYELIRDKDPQVIINAVLALNEILKDEGGIALNQKIVLHLLDVFKYLNGWAQCYVLDLLLSYQPSQEEIFPIMNVLDEKLKHPNAGVVLGVIKLFLKYTENIPEVHTQVYLRVKEPLITLMAATTPELEHVILSHIKVLAEREETAFQDQYKRFFCRHSDPQYNKLIKIEILQVLANEINFHDIVSELSQYAMDMNVEVSKKAMTVLGRIANKLRSSVDHIVHELLTILDVGNTVIVDTAIVTLKDILRTYPAFATSVVAELPHALEKIVSPEAKAAAVWMLGEYGDQLDDAPYLLENFADSYAEEDSTVRIQLISAAVKLFFKRPAEMQTILMRILSLSCADSSHPDVRDRAQFVTRLLSRDANLARELLLAPTSAISLFDEDILPEVKDKIFDEFNTLSVIYGIPSERYLMRKTASIESELATTATEPVEQEEENTPVHSVDVTPTSTVVASNSPSKHDDISVALKPNPVLDPKTYEAMWKKLPVAQTLQREVVIATRDPKIVERSLRSHNMASVALGVVKNMMKIYLYAQEEGTDEYVLMEFVANLDTSILTVTFKSQDADLANRVCTTFSAAFLTSMHG